ncbi:hypothetical protein N7493_006014 [Penicillium malachiteum]|uniref:Uncharacterized protein n=1 Tax=Penicillium malachiteum TaxID=1324776 RepID=A0AAD6MW53_9EURO|nr:hypothetical protein N7493_006014 [Penicillium malachiteum]
MKYLFQPEANITEPATEDHWQTATDNTDSEYDISDVLDYPVPVPNDFPQGCGLSLTDSQLHKAFLSKASHKNIDPDNGATTVYCGQSTTAFYSRKKQLRQQIKGDSIIAKRSSEVLRGNAGPRWRAAAASFHEPEVFNSLGKVRIRANCAFKRHQANNGRFQRAGRDGARILEASS